MDESLISEIRNYSHPPEVVKTVMAAVFMLLGENPKVTGVSTFLCCDVLTGGWDKNPGPYSVHQGVPRQQ